jgi:hypothetical protein
MTNQAREEEEGLTEKMMALTRPVRAIRVQHTENDFCRLVEWINGHGLSCDQVLKGVSVEHDIRWWVLADKTVRVYTDAEFAALYRPSAGGGR